jgi:hypothetical protein
VPEQNVLPPKPSAVSFSFDFLPRLLQPVLLAPPFGSGFFLQPFLFGTTKVGRLPNRAPTFSTLSRKQTTFFSLTHFTMGLAKMTVAALGLVGGAAAALEPIQVKVRLPSPF